MNPDKRGSVLRLRLPQRRTSARALRVALARHLARNRVPRDVARDVLLAADEAFINAFMHSGDVTGDVDVWAEVGAGRVSVEISDRGCGFELGSIDVHALPDPLRDHGRGLFLMYRLMDDVRVSSRTAERPGTSVRMSKAFGPHHAPAERSATPRP